MSEGSAGDPGPLRLDVPAVVESLDDVHAAIERLWAGHPTVGDRDRMRFEMAVIEVVGNIVEHAYRHDEPTGPGRRRIDVTLDVDATSVRAVLGDDGVPAALDLSSVALPDDDAESGRGLALALAALDDLAYRRDGARNTWSLTCRRASP